MIRVIIGALFLIGISTACQNNEVETGYTNIFDGLLEGTWNPIKLNNSGEGSFYKNNRSIISEVLTDAEEVQNRIEFPKGYTIAFTLESYHHEVWTSNAELFNTGAFQDVLSRNLDAGELCGENVSYYRLCPDLDCLVKELEFSLDTQNCGSVDVHSLGTGGFFLCFYEITC